MSKDKNILRFAAGETNDVRSSTWKLWSKKNDIYLAARSFGGVSKFSFHESGKNRFAINADITRPNPESDRAIYKWERTAEVASGLTICIGILVPARISNLPFQNVYSEKKPIEFISAPDIGEKLIINIFLSDKNKTNSELARALNIANLKIHGKIETNKEYVWLTSFTEKFDVGEQEIIQDTFTKLKIHLKPGSSSSDMKFAFLHVLTEKPRPFLADIELGAENLDIPD